MRVVANQDVGVKVLAIFVSCAIVLLRDARRNVMAIRQGVSFVLSVFMLYGLVYELFMSFDCVHELVLACWKRIVDELATIR